MKIKFVRLENFRNAEFADVPLGSQNVWIRGRNAQGKSNLLEALGMLRAMRSFRTPDMSALVRRGEKLARIFAGIEFESGGECSVEISISDKRKAVVDGEEIKYSEFIGRFPALAMGSADIAVLRGSPEARRRDCDIFISSIDRGYFESLKIYHGALAHRNALLRAGAENPAEYTPFEAQMARAAAEIYSARKEKLGALGAAASEIYSVLARENGEGAEIKIKPDCDADDEASLLETLARTRAKDIERKATSRGPHRDDFKILIGGADAKAYASEGQQRSAVIALKLAQFAEVKRAAQTAPAILCDDILGELDAGRRAAFWECVDPSSQIIATSTEPPPPDGVRGKWSVIEVENGKFRAL
ncbi:MAG: DNA replication and repair protein RecF [Opitutales bacterium]|nr:DNA replication and repair protein RecF [Opitutales bacterium]